MNDMTLKPYPVFLISLEHRRCVVLGGGHEAERKTEGLLECDAQVTVIATEVSPTLQRYAEEGRLTWTPRGFRPGDLQHAFIVIATGQDGETNRRVYNEAMSQGALVNVVDDVEHCTFIAGSVVRRGPLVVSISTSGCAPTLAVRLREWLERELGQEYAVFLELLAALREPMSQSVLDFDERRALWYRLVDSDALDLLRRGKHGAALRHLAAIIGQRFETSITSQDSPTTRRPISCIKS